MELKKLKNSIALNSNEKPSIYSAICMIETLFKDIKDESGVSIQNNPPGDEMLPTKLIWLCRAINEIYTANRTEFNRNTSKLDEKIKQLKETEKELEDLSEIAQKLADTKKRLTSLEEKLEIARNDKREYDIICKKLSIAEERLAEASKFDKEFARKKLDEIELQTGKFEAENETVLKALEKAEKARSAAEADNAELAGRHALICDILKALEEERESLRHEIEAASDDMRELEHEKNRLLKEKDEIVSKHAALETQKNSLCADKNNYFSSYILPLETEIEKLESEIAGFEEEKSKLDKKYKETKQRKDELTFAIALVSTDIDNAEKKSIEKQESLKTENESLDLARQKNERLEHEISYLADKLAELQTEISEIENDKLPQARLLVEQKTERVSELKKQLDITNGEITQVGNELPNLEEELAAKKAVYNALTASYNTKSSEIKDLEDKINELRGKTDEEKHNRYKLQLEDNISKLTARIEECESLEEEIRNKEKAIDEAEAEQSRLKCIKNSHEDAKRKIDALLKELMPIASDEYLLRIQCTERRLDLLSGTHEKLMSSLALVRETLGLKQDDNITTLESLKTDIGGLELCVESLRKALLCCADGVKMEEK